MTFANCQMGGMHLAVPDVCLTPVGNSIVPIPYPNVAQGAMADPSTAEQKILISGTPAHTLKTMVPTSSGDEPGVVGGVMSGTIKGPQRHLMGANSILIGGMPATKMTDQTGQNGSSFNAQGTTTAPAQTKVTINSGGNASGGTSVQARGTVAQRKKDEPLEFTLTNLRWENKTHPKDKSKIAQFEEIVALKVDVKVHKGKLAPNQYVIFGIFNKEDNKHLAVAMGTINKDNIGEAIWRVRDPSGAYSGKELSLIFNARVLSIKSGNASLPVQYVKPTIVLHDSVGDDAAPLINTKWKLYFGRVFIEKGITKDDGVVSLKNNLNPYRQYRLIFAGREIVLHAKYANMLDDAEKPNGAHERLVMLGYNCGSENEYFGEYSRASMLGYRDDKGLGYQSGSPFDSKVAESLDKDITPENK